METLFRRLVAWLFGPNRPVILAIEFGEIDVRGALVIPHFDGGCVGALRAPFQPFKPS